MHHYFGHVIINSYSVFSWAYTDVYFSNKYSRVIKLYIYLFTILYYFESVKDNYISHTCAHATIAFTIAPFVSRQKLIK